MTGAHSTGSAFYTEQEPAVTGSLHEVIHHIQQNQCELNTMFKDVITDFQVRLIENQSLVVQKQVDIDNSITNILGILKLITENMRTTNEILEKICEKVSADAA